MYKTDVFGGSAVSADYRFVYNQPVESSFLKYLSNGRRHLNLEFRRFLRLSQEDDIWQNSGGFWVSSGLYWLVTQD